MLADDNALPATAAPAYPTSAPTPSAYPTPAPTNTYNEPAVDTNVLRSDSNITFIQTSGNGQFSTIDLADLSSSSQELTLLDQI